MILSDFFVPPMLTAPKKFQLTGDQKLILMPVGDVHAFSRGWPEQRFVDHIKWGVDRGAHFLGMGEYFDFASGSQRKVMKELRAGTMEEVDQWRAERVERFFHKIAFSKGAWLGLLEGHHYHEYQDGTTTDQHLCRLLAAPFLGTSTLLRLQLVHGKSDAHQCHVLVYAHHGPNGSAGRKQGSKLHRLEDLITGIEADIYLMGHDHSKANAPLDRLYPTPDHRHIYHRTKILARTGGFLRGYFGQGTQSLVTPAFKSRGSYVETAALTPSALGGIVIDIGVKRLVKRGEYDFMVPDIHYAV